MNSEYINLLIEEEIEYSNKLAFKYRYPDNITHLLYLIIPAFIIKYGRSNKSIIEKCFMDTPIRVDKKYDKMYQAYYFSVPEYDHDNKIILNKGIVLRDYNDATLMGLLDNLVHEYNHAINSINNEILIIDNYIKVRTGISYNIFDKRNLEFVRKTDEITLEEVINTKQTESIINIIKDFNDYKIDNTTVNNTLFSINHSAFFGYKSNSYLLESIVCRKLMENKTFISTFEKLRFDGQIEDLHSFFDTITGIDNSFSNLCTLLSKILDLNIMLSKATWFKTVKINKIRSLTSDAIKIVDKFNQSTIYK